MSASRLPAGIRNAAFVALGHTYGEYVRLARMCWRQAAVTQDPHVSHHLRQMAREYQQEAAKLDGGKLPDIGDPQTT